MTWLAFQSRMNYREEANRLFETDCLAWKLEAAFWRERCCREKQYLEFLMSGYFEWILDWALRAINGFGSFE